LERGSSPTRAPGCGEQVTRKPLADATRCRFSCYGAAFTAPGTRPELAESRRSGSGARMQLRTLTCEVCVPQERYRLLVLTRPRWARKRTFGLGPNEPALKGQRLFDTARLFARDAVHLSIEAAISLAAFWRSPRCNVTRSLTVIARRTQRMLTVACTRPPASMGTAIPVSWSSNEFW
jgi:hypothetical protein